MGKRGQLPTLDSEVLPRIYKFFALNFRGNICLHLTFCSRCLVVFNLLSLQPTDLVIIYITIYMNNLSFYLIQWSIRISY